MPSCSFPRTITQIVQLSTIWEAFHKEFVRAYVLKHRIVAIYIAKKRERKREKIEERKFKKFCVLLNVFQNKILFNDYAWDLYQQLQVVETWIMPKQGMTM